MIKEYGVVDSWTKLFIVNLNGGLLRLLGLQKNGNILVEAKLPHCWGITRKMMPFKKKKKKKTAIEKVFLKISTLSI